MKQESYEKSELYKLRHSAAHVLAMAALEFDPEAKLAIGPPIETGFYYDFQFSRPISESDLEKMEKSMAKIIKEDFPVRHKTIAHNEAIKKLKKDQQPFKLELAQDLKDDDLSFYGIDTFWDLCKGPHVKSTGEIKAFKLLSIAGAYWRGDEHQPMLTRIYGTAFSSQKQLDDHLLALEEAKKRDHRKLGRELGIFMISPEIGSGLPLWLPRGATLYRLLKDYLTKLETEQGYQHVITSELGKAELYKKSGHLSHYADGMYPPIELDDETFYLRPMNCPHHIMIFNDGLKSYRDLPVRIAEFGEVFRREKSGELSGLQRVRSFSINDAHIFCQESQIKDEFRRVVELLRFVYKKLELEDWWFQLSLRGDQNKDKYSDNILVWEKSEKVLRETLREMNVDFIEAKDEAAFYGPKLDIQMKNINGKEETIATIQLDFYLPKQFGIEYIDDTGKKQTPVMIHRAIFGSMERFIGFYLEKTGGEFPLWLSPVQVRVLPISEKAHDYATEIKRQLMTDGFRVEIDESAETLGKRIRQSELEKIPHTLIIGEKEMASKKVAVRSRHTAEQPVITLAEFTKSYLADARQP
ncbi:MAG: threonine--tRNA ligase [Patescibacteria group bacterium]